MLLWFRSTPLANLAPSYVNLQILVLPRKAFFDSFGIISLHIFMEMLPALEKCNVVVYSTTEEI